MRIIFLFSLASLLSLASLSCNPNSKCEDIECLNGGTCWEGDCQCPNGFLGMYCDSLDPNFQCDRIIDCLPNNYQGREACDYASDKVYPSTISKLVNDSNAIAISNFSDANYEVIAYVNGIEIEIPTQLVNGYNHFGIGEIDTTQYPYLISLTYQKGNAVCVAEFSIN